MRQRKGEATEMNILIVGSGAREHAIAAALHRSPQEPRIFCCGILAESWH